MKIESFGWGGAPSSFTRILLDYDSEGTGGSLPGVSGEGAGEATAVESHPSDIPAGTQGTTVSTADAPVQASAAAQQQAQATASNWTSIRDAARNYGLDLSQFGDDHAAFAHLVNQARQAQQANYYAQLGQQLAPHAQGIREYIQQRQQPQQQQQRNPWEPPQIDQRILALMQRDEATGLLVAKHPSVPAELVQQANEYVRWHEQFRDNPAALIQPLVEQRAAEQARQIVQQEMQAYQQQQQVQGILAQNASWMYATDERGQFLRRPDGAYVPSPLGTRYIQHLQTVAAQGVTDPVAQDALARQLVRGDLMAAMVQRAQGQQATAVPSATQTRLQPNVNPGQVADVTQQTTQPDATGKSIQQQLREALAREGITDAELEASFVP